MTPEKKSQPTEHITIPSPPQEGMPPEIAASLGTTGHRKHRPRYYKTPKYPPQAHPESSLDNQARAEISANQLEEAPPDIVGHDELTDLLRDALVPGEVPLPTFPSLEEIKTGAEKVEELARKELTSKVLLIITPELVGGLLQELCGTGRLLPAPPKWEVPDPAFWWRKVLVPAVIAYITPEYIRQTEPWVKLLRGEDSYFHQPRWTALTVAIFALFNVFPTVLQEEMT